MMCLSGLITASSVRISCQGNFLQKTPGLWEDKIVSFQSDEWEGDMKSCTIILIASIIILFSLECGAQVLPKSTTLPVTKGKIDEPITSTVSQKSTGARVSVINTQTFTITGITKDGAFSPVNINTQTFAITGVTTGGTFSPVNINTQTFAITGSSGGK
jgi:hypothetical protein